MHKNRSDGMVKSAITRKVVADHIYRVEKNRAPLTSGLRMAIASITQDRKSVVLCLTFDMQHERFGVPMHKALGAENCQKLAKSLT